METKIDKYKQKGIMHLGDGLFLDLYLGASANGEGGSSDNGNIVNVSQQYGEGKALQQVFSIPQGHSVIMAVRMSIMGTTYTDLLRYSCGADSVVQNFYCDNIIQFVENKALNNYGAPVCIEAKQSSQAPSAKYTFKVLYASCGVDKITWYENKFVNKASLARYNERLTLKVDPIDEDAETTQKVYTNSNGIPVDIDFENYVDFIVDASASEGLIKFTGNIPFKENIIYRMMSNCDGTLTFSGMTNVINLSTEIYGDSVVSISFQLASGTTYNPVIDQKEVETYYTKSDVDNLVDKKISQASSNYVHLTGYEEITGGKTFKGYLNVAYYLTFRDNGGTTALFRPMSSYSTYEGGGLRIESGWISLNHPGIIASGDDRVITGHDVWGYFNTNAEKLNNKVTSISESSTDVQYPSAKCVFDKINSVTGSFVHLTGDETINGKKTFNDYVKSIAGFEASNSVKLTAVSSGRWASNASIQLNNLNLSGSISPTEARLVTGSAVYEELKDYFRKSYISTYLDGDLTDNEVPSAKCVYTELEYLKALNTTLIVNMTNYAGETVSALSTTRKIVITQSYGSSSVIDISAISLLDGTMLEIYNANGNTFKIKYDTTEKTMEGCSNCRVVGIIVNGDWKFYKEASLTEI